MQRIQTLLAQHGWRRSTTNPGGGECGGIHGDGSRRRRCRGTVVLYAYTRIISVVGSRCRGCRSSRRIIGDCLNFLFRNVGGLRGMSGLISRHQFNTGSSCTVNHRRLVIGFIVNSRLGDVH